MSPYDSGLPALAAFLQKALLSFLHLFRRKDGGDERVRTDDPLLAKQVLSQLSYTPTVIPAFVLLPFESTVSSTLKTIQCNQLKLEFVFYAALNRDRLEHFCCTP